MQTSIPETAVARITETMETRGHHASIGDVLSIVSEIMPSDTRYNGWTNYETWVAGMYIDGNYTGEGTCRHYESMVRHAVEEREDDESADDIAISLADNLKSNVEAEIFDYDETRDALSTGIVGDLLGAALSEINWYEIAKGRVEDSI